MPRKALIFELVKFIVFTFFGSVNTGENGMIPKNTESSSNMQANTAKTATAVFAALH